jgi:hypothetical protein
MEGGSQPKQRIRAQKWAKSYDHPPSYGSELEHSGVVQWWSCGSYIYALWLIHPSENASHSVVRVLVLSCGSFAK